jgi:predicted transcriptional regulator
MKFTSIIANLKAGKFKGSHKQKILHFLNGEMTGKEIAKASGLKFESVMRRVSELEKENKIITKGTKNGFTVYKLSN